MRARGSAASESPASLNAAMSFQRSASRVTRLASRVHASPSCGATTMSSVYSALSDARNSGVTCEAAMVFGRLDAQSNAGMWIPMSPTHHASSAAAHGQIGNATRISP